MESTVVRYLMQGILHRAYTLECTQQAMVSDKDLVGPVPFIELYGQYAVVYTVPNAYGVF